MEGKGFEIKPVSEIKPDQIIVIDNGAFRIIMNRGKLEKLLQSKNISLEKQQRVWNDILNFRDEINSVKEKYNLGSTDPIGAISSKLFESLGESLFSDEEIKSLYSN